MKLRRRKTALSFGVLAFIAVVMSCREPTEITVVIKSGEKCSDISGVEIVVGPNQTETQSRFEKQFTAALSHDCDGSGLVGTLVVTPGGHGGTIVVAAGVRVGGAPAPDPASCATAASAKSCIIARRSFSFLSHTSLTLPIELDPLCIGQACDPASTCFKGRCVDANVTCNGVDCGLPQENPGQGTGGGNEAGSSDGAYDDVLDGPGFEDVRMGDSGSDATTMAEAGPDADADASGFIPPCTSGGTAFCCPICGDASGGGSGARTAGSCAPGNDPNGSCCFCVCALNSKVVSCDLGPFAQSGASCQPTMCP